MQKQIKTKSRMSMPYFYTFKSIAELPSWKLSFSYGVWSFNYAQNTLSLFVLPLTPVHTEDISKYKHCRHKSKYRKRKPFLYLCLCLWLCSQNLSVAYVYDYRTRLSIGSRFESNINRNFILKVLIYHTIYYNRIQSTVFHHALWPKKYRTRSSL